MAQLHLLSVLFLGCIFAPNIHGQSVQVNPPIPILKTVPGEYYGLGDAASPVQLEAFIELNCGDSYIAWPELKRVSDHYGDKVGVKILHMILPYHRNAFLCTQGYYQVLDKDPENGWNFFSAVLDDYASFLNSNTINNSESDVGRYMSEIAANVTNIDQTAFYNDLYKYSAITRNNWKYAVKRGAAGTPWYFINGIDLAVNPDDLVDFDTWKSVIDPLLGIEEKKDSNDEEPKALHIQKQLDQDKPMQKSNKKYENLAEDVQARLALFGKKKRT